MRLWYKCEHHYESERWDRRRQGEIKEDVDWTRGKVISCIGYVKLLPYPWLEYSSPEELHSFLQLRSRYTAEERYDPISGAAGHSNFFLCGNYEHTGPYREEHLSNIQEEKRKGTITHAGALANPVDSAAIVFRVHDTKYIQDFVERDPYYTKGNLIKSYSIREWLLVWF